MSRYKGSMHRVIWERANGPTPDGWHIHHINGDSRDNRLENLRAMPASEHLSMHGRNHPTVERMCDHCGCQFVAHRSWARWCSARCKEAQRRADGVAYTRHRTGPWREDRTCEECAGEYVAKRPWARFCSPACKQRAGRRSS